MTQRVSLAEVEDLVSGRARAAIAYAGADGPECVPVVVEQESDLRVGVYPRSIPASGMPERAVLVIDAGAYWFDLRAAVWRGTLAASHDGPEGFEDSGLVWFRLDPVSAIAWDYARLREDSAS